MTGNNLVIRIVLLIAAIGSIAAVLYALWQQGGFLPGWGSWENRELCDASLQYEIRLNRKAVSVQYDNEIIWTSSAGVKVQDVLSCDVDGDAEDELVLLCWKRGRYGKDRPFWVKEDEKSWSQHIFVYEYQKETVKPKWMSSYIGQDIVTIAADKNKAPFHRLLFTDREGKATSWVWDSWGFVKEDTDISFAVFGDNLIHEPIYRYGLNHGGDFDFLYENLQDVIAESDVAVINQETPLVDDPSLYGDYPRFGTPVQVGEAIADAGFDVVTCATNHALDRGDEGIRVTKEFFDLRGVACLGVQTENEKEYEPYEILVRNGIRFAMLNYTYGTNGIKIPEENPYMVHLLENEDQIRSDIGRAREEADCVIVFVHWGTENSGQIDDFQKKWAQVFLECRADVVVGTHPHVMQPYEVLKGDDGHRMLIYYSIGNYISAQPEKSCTKGGMASFTVSLTPAGYQVTEYDLTPLTIRWEGQGKYTVE